MKKTIVFTLCILIANSSFGQDIKTEFKNDTLYVDGKAIYAGLEMSLGKPEKRVFENVVMGQTKFMTTKAPSAAFFGAIVKVVSLDEKKGVYSFKCKPQDALSGATKAVMNAMQSLWVTDIVAAFKVNELLFIK
jgi:hypothetical protein